MNICVCDNCTCVIRRLYKSQGLNCRNDVIPRSSQDEHERAALQPPTPRSVSRSKRRPASGSRGFGDNKTDGGVTKSDGKRS